MTDSDVLPLPLTDDDDFFSDLSGDETYINMRRPMAIGKGSKLIIDHQVQPDHDHNVNISVGNSMTVRNHNDAGHSDMLTTQTVNASNVISYDNHNDNDNVGSLAGRTNPFSFSTPRSRNVNANHTHSDSVRNGHSHSASHTRSENHDSEIAVGSHRDEHSHTKSQSGVSGNDSTSNYSHVHKQTNSHSSLNHSHSASTATWDHCHVPLKPNDNTVRNQLIVISIFTTVFGVAETVGAVYSGSIAIGTDVMHLASDLLSFVISLIAVYLAKKPPTARLPWGFHRAEVLGALLSVFVIWVVTGILVYLAVERIITKDYDSLEPSTMLYTSIAGVVFNIIMAVVLNVDVFKCKVSHGHSHGGGGHGHSHSGGGHGHSGGGHSHSGGGHSHGGRGGHSHSGGGGGHSHSGGGGGHLRLSRRRRDDRDQLTEHTDDEVGDVTEYSATSSTTKKEKNIVIRAAFVHVLGDLIQSVGVFVSALIIKFKGYKIADPICTFTFSVLVLITTATVLRDAFFMLMEGCPKKIPYDHIYNRLMELPGVKAVHSLRVWAMTATEVCATVHLAVDESCTSPYELVKQATRILREGEVIARTSVQVEPYNELFMRTCFECKHPGPHVGAHLDII